MLLSFLVRVFAAAVHPVTINGVDDRPDVLDQLGAAQIPQPAPRFDLRWLDRTGLHARDPTAVEVGEAGPEDHVAGRKFRLVA